MTPREARRAVDMFTALVAGSIGIALAGLTWRLLGDPGERLATAPTVARIRRPIDLGPLIALAPFGGGASAPATPTTDQSLALRGILLAEPRSASSALISVNGAPPAPFYVGQAVGPGTIAAIEIDHVVLATGGGQQSLAFPDRAAADAGGPAAPAASAPGMSQVPPASPSAPSPTSGASLLSGLGAPAADGLHVAQPNEQMRGAGLQPGDVVTTIDGIPAASAARDPALLAPSLAAGSVQLDIVRDGRHLTLAMPLR